MGQPASGASVLASRRGVLGGGAAGALFSVAARAQSPRDTIVVGLVNYPPNIKPLENTGSSQGAVKLAIWRSLLSYDAEGRLQPELAASWTQEGSTAHLLTLRDDAVFHNGAPVTAEDVAFTIGLIRDPKQTAFLRADFDVVDRVDVLGPKALRIVLKQPSAPFPNLLASYHAPILCKAAGDPDPSRPIGVKSLSRARYAHARACAREG